MDLLLVLTIIAACLGVAGFAVVLRKLAAGPRTLPVTAEWIDDLSVERYRPMLRLLSEDDLSFLASQPGYTPQMGRRFRLQRCQIFRNYLRWLRSDFGRVCTALRVLMVQSQYDRPDLATFLMRQQLAFAVGMVSIQFHLFLYRWGIAGVEVDGVMRAFDSLRVELRHLVPLAAGSQV
jgi:hypothetical protein